MQRTDKNIVKKAVFNRPDDANKGTCGSLLTVCGCYSMAGAVILADKAALRCGIGLLKSAVADSIYPIMAPSVPEAVFFPLAQTPSGKISKDNIDFLLEQSEKSSAVLLGCGLSVCDDTEQLVYEFVKNCRKPMVLDADALNCISKNPQILNQSKADIIVTPHPAEMARLINTSAQQVNAYREQTAVNFANEFGVVCVLKGSGTIIAAPDGRVMINSTGNSGMATGGSGDVLAGMISSLLAGGKSTFDCAAAGVYLHGLAGDIAKQKFGKISMLPTDIIECIPQAFADCGL